MTFINVIQFTVALFIDSRYEKKNMAGLIFVSWYPTVYWIINAAVVVGFPKALKRKKGGYAHGQAQTEGIPNAKIIAKYCKRNSTYRYIVCLLDIRSVVLLVHWYYI